MTGTATSDEAIVELSVDVFSIDAVKRAAYALMDRFDIQIEAEGQSVTCKIAPLRDGVDTSTAERDFRREVVDQDLRIAIEQRTAQYRDAILGLAFSRTGLQDG